GSRRVRNTVLVPGRREICATCPSTPTQPSRPIHSPIRWLTTRTGQGCSGLLRGGPPLPAGEVTGWFTGSGYRPGRSSPPTAARLARPGLWIGPCPRRPPHPPWWGGSSGDRVDALVRPRRMGGVTASHDPQPTDLSEPQRKRVLLASPRGYCAGVDRAVQTVEQALELYGPPIYVRKQIVHNRHVVSTL